MKPSKFKFSSLASYSSIRTISYMIWYTLHVQYSTVNQIAVRDDVLIDCILYCMYTDRKTVHTVLKRIWLRFDLRLLRISFGFEVGRARSCAMDSFQASTGRNDRPSTNELTLNEQRTMNNEQAKRINHQESTSIQTLLKYHSIQSNPFIPLFYPRLIPISECCVQVEPHWHQLQGPRPVRYPPVLQIPPSSQEGVVLVVVVVAASFPNTTGTQSTFQSTAMPMPMPMPITFEPWVPVPVRTLTRTPTRQTLRKIPTTTP